MGFDTGSSWPNPRRNPEMNLILKIREWWKWRHFEDSPHSRECIREAVADLRELRAAQSVPRLSEN